MVRFALRAQEEAAKVPRPDVRQQDLRGMPVESLMMRVGE